MRNFMYVVELLAGCSLITVGVFKTQDEAQRQLKVVCGEKTDVEYGCVYEVEVGATYKNQEEHRIVFSFEREEE